MELEDVDCQSALFSVACGVCGHGLNVPHHPERHPQFLVASFLGKTKRVMTPSHSHTCPLSFLVARACEVVCGVKEVVGSMFDKVVHPDATIRDGPGEKQKAPTDTMRIEEISRALLWSTRIGVRCARLCMMELGRMVGLLGVVYFVKDHRRCASRILENERACYGRWV